MENRGQAFVEVSSEEQNDRASVGDGFLTIQVLFLMYYYFGETGLPLHPLAFPR